MQSYTIQTAGGRQAHIVSKESGRKRSLRLFFIRIKRSRMLIAYVVSLQDVNTTSYTLYKIRKTGLWLKGAEKKNGKIENDERILIEDLKKSVDTYENAFGSNAYKLLF